MKTSVVRYDDNHASTCAKPFGWARLFLLLLVFFAGTLSADEALLLTRPNDSLEARLELIGAGDEIHIGTYIFGNDPAAHRLLAAVRAAARRGAKVNIIIDAFENQLQKGMIRHLTTDPESGGRIQIKVYHPLNFYNPLQFLYRLHAKWLVVRNSQTGEVSAVVGGRNSWDRSLGKRKDADKDMDLLVKGESANSVLEFARNLLEEKDHVKDPGAFDSTIDFRKALNWFWFLGRRQPREWQRWTADYQDSPYPRPQHWVKDYEVDSARDTLDEYALKEDRRREKTSESPTRWRDATKPVENLRYVADRPDGTNRIMLDILSMIEHAEKSVLISSAYLTIPHELENAIAAAKKRGVEVTILTNSSLSSDVALVQAAYENRINRLLALDVKVYEFRSERLLHEKSVVVDGHKVFIGSVNMDPRSAGWNLENGYFVEDAAVAERVTQVIGNGIKTAARVLTPADIFVPKNCARWWLRVKARILHRTL